MTTRDQSVPTRPPLALAAAAALVVSGLLLGGCSSGGAGKAPPSASPTTGAARTAAPTVHDDLSPEKPWEIPREAPTDDPSAAIVSAETETESARHDASVDGAVATARSFVVAWLSGYATGDTTVFDELRLPECSFCEAASEQFAAPSTRDADSAELQLRTTLLDVTEPTEADPSTVVTIGGRRSFTADVTEGNVTRMIVSDPKDFLLVVTLTWTDAGWAVREGREAVWSAPADW